MYRDISYTQSHDAFWIFTLWRALHSGDATLADIAAQVIANLSQYLPAQENSFGVQPLPPSSSIVTVRGPEDSVPAGNDEVDQLAPDSSDPLEQPALFCNDPGELSPFHNYFSFKGVFYRIDRPAFACLMSD